MKDPEKTIGALIDKQSVAFIASIDADGYPNMKAMLAPRKREGLRMFYFSTNTSSMRVLQYAANSKASIYFCAPSSYKGVMLVGEMTTLTDQKYKDMLWKRGDTRYYPRGVTDPDYCVLRFEAKTWRLYSNFRSEKGVIE